MEAVFLKLLNMSIVAGWLVLAIVLLRFVLKKAPKSIRCFLWALVAFRLLCPVSLESVLSLIPSAETIPQDILYSQKPEIHSGIQMLNTVVNPVLSDSMAPASGDSVNPMQVVIYIASRAWIIGVLGMVLYACISYYRIYKQVAVSMQLESNLYVCDDIESPFILGIVRPRIYLPSILEEDKKAYVIAHERAHLKRHDHWWKPLGFVLLTVYWFHPLMWLGFVLLCRDIELACDEKVIQELGEEQKKPYSEALLYCSVPRRLIVACPLAFGEVGVKERVKMVLHYKKPAFWVIVAAGLVCVIVAVCFLTNPKEDSSATNPLGHSYFVKAYCYSTPRDMIYSVVYPVERMPLYGFTADMVMMQKENRLITDTSGVLATVNKEWQQVGAFQEIKLTEENFDNYFKDFEGVSDLGWYNGMTAKVFREENETAWEVLTDGEYSYYLLQQEDGAVYLAVWYYDEDRERASAFDDSYIRWLFRLERADMVSCFVETPEKNAFFAMDWYPDGSLEEYYEDMPMAEVAEFGTLIFQVEGAQGSLQIEEECYWKADGKWCKEEIGKYTLTPNGEGKFVVELARAHQGEAYSVYMVLHQDGKYVMRVRYPENTEWKDADDVRNEEKQLEAIHQGQSFQNTTVQGSNVSSEKLITQGNMDAEIGKEPQEDSGQREQTWQENLSALDLAIRQAILGNKANNNIKGVLFNCASHIILGTETMCGVPLVDGGAAKEYVTVYAWTAKQSYVYQYPTGAIKDGNGGTDLVILRFEVTENGEYILDEHLNIEGIVYARDREKVEEKYDSVGRAYKTHFQKMFPEEIYPAVLL